MPENSLIGRTIVGHRLEELIGEGGMGVVYRARHEQLDRVRAIKLLPPGLARDDSFRERFEREWRLAAAIEHPNIVEVLDAGEADEHLYIVMRLVDGPDLARLVSTEGPLTPERSLRLLEQIGDALDAAHSQQLVHRDVTPRNIIVGPGDRAFLADFGVARTTTTKGLTRTGYFVGNLDYAAPEQIEGRPLDGRADIYALGGVLYTCLTAHPPYERDTDVQLMYAQLNEPPPLPSKVDAGLPPALDRVVEKAMAKSRDDRYQTCREFIDDLAAAVASLGHDGAPDAAATVDRRAVRTRSFTGLAGDRVGEFLIQRRLGQGGMGVVYLAERPRLGSHVALKILSDDLADDERFRDRFVRESQMASALDHPNIIPVYDAGESDGVFYICMRYVDGPSLKALLEKEAPLEPKRALSLLSQVAGALDVAHEHGLVHRDVKPANILVTRGGGSDFGEHVYLTDFGVSKRIESHSGLTGTGQFIGTLSYAAPEQIQGLAVDRRADIYALGCILYEALAGRKPFERENDAAVLWAHVTEPPPRLSEHRNGLPQALDAVVEHALAKSPEERFDTCGGLIAAARSCFSDATTLPGTIDALATPTVALPTIASDAEPEPAAPAGEDRSAALITPTIADTAPAGPATEDGPPATETADRPAAPPTVTVADTAPATPETEDRPAAAISPTVPSDVPARTPPPPSPPQPPPTAPRPAARRRRALVVGALVLVLGGAGAAAAFVLAGSSGSKHPTVAGPPSLPSPPAPQSPPSPPSPPSTPTGLRETGFRHGRAVAGHAFTASLAVARRGSSAPIATAIVGCPAHLGAASMAGTSSFGDGLATCRWTLPPGKERWRLSGSVTVSSGRQSVAHRFSIVLAAAPEHLVLVSRPTHTQPQAGSPLSAQARLVRVDDRGHRLGLVPSATRAFCGGRVGNARFTPGTATVTPAGVTCTWAVPRRAAGRRVELRIVVRTNGRTRVVLVRAPVPAAVQPTSPPSQPPTPPTPPPPSPPTPPSPQPGPPPPAPTQTAPIPQ